MHNLLSSIHARFNTSPPTNVIVEKEEGRPYIGKESLGGQQVLPFCGIASAFPFLVSPLPSQLTWFRCSTSYRSRHMTQAWDFLQSDWKKWFLVCWTWWWKDVCLERLRASTAVALLWVKTEQKKAKWRDGKTRFPMTSLYQWTPAWPGSFYWTSYIWRELIDVFLFVPSHGFSWFLITCHWKRPG